MKSDDTLRTIWRRFRLGGELRPLVCLAATIAAGLILGGFGVGGGWLRGMFRDDPGGSGRIVGDVHDDDIGTGLMIAAIIWLITTIWLWRPAVRLNRRSFRSADRNRWASPLIAVAFLAGAATILTFVLNTRPWDDRGFAVAAILLVCAGLAVVLWLPLIFHLEQGKPVVREGGVINLNCPKCSYSMAGLREAVCPECGARYTLDELVLAQNYEALRKATESTHRRAESPREPV